MFIKRLVFILVSVWLLAGCEQEPTLYKNIDNQQLKEFSAQGVQIFDVRRPEEWKQTGVVANSNKLTSFDKGGRLKPEFLPLFTKAVNKDQPVILICRTGNRTRTLSKFLSEKLGYTKILNVKNGITHWIREGHPVTRG